MYYQQELVDLNETRIQLEGTVCLFLIPLNFWFMTWPYFMLYSVIIHVLATPIFGRSCPEAILVYCENLW